MKRCLCVAPVLFFIFGCERLPSPEHPSEAVENVLVEAQPVTQSPLDDFQAQYVLFPGADIERAFSVPPNASVDSATGDKIVLSTPLEIEPVSSGRTSGVNIEISEELERAFSGSSITIRVVARASGIASGKLRMAYSTNDVGNSGWKDFELGSDYKLCEFEYQVAPMAQGRGDFLGFITEGATIEIARVGIDLARLPTESQSSTQDPSAGDNVPNLEP